MKTQNKILLLFTFMLVVLSANSQIFKGKAQKEKPVRYNVIEGDKYRGWIFIDGKYIDAPYKVKRKGTAIYINGIQITKIEKKDPWFINGKVGYPPKLTDSSSYEDLTNIINPNLGISYYKANYNYFFKHYKYDDAWDSLANYVRNAPNIKEININNHKISNILCKNGEAKEFIYPFDGTVYENSLIWGPNGYGKKWFEATAEQIAEGIRRTLEENNEGIAYFTERYSGSPHFNLDSCLRILDVVKEGYPIQQGAEELKHILYNNKNAKTFIENFQSSKQLEKRYELLIEYIEKKERNSKKSVGNLNIKKITTTDTISITEKSTTVYSTPYKNSFYAWFGNAWEYGDAIIEDELTTVRNNIINQGFNQPIIFKDLTANDNDFGNCTYQNLVSMKNAGFLYYGGHGDMCGGLFLVFGTSEYALINWKQNDPNIIIGQCIEEEKPPEWNSNLECWYAFATPAFFQGNWQATLTASNAIVMISACYGGLPNIIGSYGGGITFAYTEQTILGHNLNPGILSNNNNLLKRMNGTTGNGQYREALNAYNNMSHHYKGFTCFKRNNITLCPAIKSTYPANGQTITTSGHLQGYFEFDSWCSTNNWGLEINLMSGNLAVTGPTWESASNGKSNKLLFDWSGSSGTIELAPNVDYVKSYGDGRSVDVNGIAPNNLQDRFLSFNVEVAPSNPPIADFAYYISSYDVTFTDCSLDSPTSWLWVFGDGTTDNHENTTHHYSSLGTYDVTLKVSNVYGISTKSKTITIADTPSSVIISGRVKNSSAGFEPVTGASVSFGQNTVYTDNSGNYSINVPYNWSGTITATKFGFSTATYTAFHITQNTNYDFYLNQISTEAYISYSPFPAHANQYITFSAHNVAAGFDWFWDFGDPSSGIANYNDVIQGHPGHNYWQAGIYLVTLTLSSGGNPVAVLYCNVAIEEAINYGNITIPPTPNFDYECDVVNAGTTVHFYDLTDYDFFRDWSAWQWTFEFDTPQETKSAFFYRTPILNQYHSNFLNSNGTYYGSAPQYLVLTHTFNNIGKKYVKYQYYLNRSEYEIITGHWVSASSSDYYYAHNRFYKYSEKWAGLIVVNCDQQHTYPFSAAITDTWASDTYGGPLYTYGGSFRFNGNANNFFANHSHVLSACNEIVITGETEFIASGNNELVLEINQNPCIQNYSNTSKSTETISENTAQHSSENNMFCFPNPFSDEINVSLQMQEYQQLNIEITDILGKIIYSSTDNFTKGNHLLKINTSKLPPNSYILNITNEKTNQTFKLVKQK